VTVAELLASGEQLPEPVKGDVLDELRGVLEHAATAAAGNAGWTAAEPLRLTKTSVTWLIRCPRRAVTPGVDGMGRDIALGAVVDAATKVATIRRLDPDDQATAVSAALGWLEVDGDGTAAWLGTLPADERASFMADAADRVGRMLAGWPSLDPSWWPRVDEWVRVHLGGGSISVSGKVDAAFGGPPTARPGVLVEVKGGVWRDEHRGDAHLYGLLAGLRDGRAPAAVATVCAGDGRVNVEQIRPAVLESAVLRITEAMGEAERLGHGEVPDANPGPYCVTCPALPDCPEGRRETA
jgi:hypothetical protein